MSKVGSHAAIHRLRQMPQDIKCPRIRFISISCNAELRTLISRIKGHVSLSSCDCKLETRFTNTTTWRSRTQQQNAAVDLQRARFV